MVSKGKYVPTASRSSIVKVPKAGELVAANLRRRIITGELKPGEQLPSESELMEEFGVSRPTLREAFRVLESESTITILRGARGGAIVLEPDGSVAARYTGLLLQYQGTPLLDVYRARAEIEVSAIGLVGARRARSVAATLSEITGRGEGLSDDAAAFTRYSAEFHRAVVNGCGNSTLGVLSMILFDIVEAHNDLFTAAHSDELRTLTANKTAHSAYLKLTRLLADADIAGAQRHWRKHLVAVEKFMVDDAETTLVEVLS